MNGLSSVRDWVSIQDSDFLQCLGSTHLRILAKTPASIGPRFRIPANIRILTNIRILVRILVQNRGCPGARVLLGVRVSLVVRVFFLKITGFGAPLSALPDTGVLVIVI